MSLEAAAGAYRGNALGCHTVAALNAFRPDYSLRDAFAFEALTGAPFGIHAHAADPNRLIVPRLDPDLGLDAAFAFLGVSSETRWFRSHESAEALALLVKWLEQSPVLLGPLDMGGLKYVRNARLLDGCDHYVAALDFDKEGLWVVDGEGAAPAVIHTEQFLPAWRATGLVEGRGAFTARRLVGGELPLPGEVAMIGALGQACRLIRASSDGPAVLRSLSNREEEILAWPAARRGLEFLLPVRCQRNMAALHFLAALAGLEKCRPNSECIASIRRYLLDQTMAIARCIDLLLERRSGCLEELRLAAGLEARLIHAYRELEDV